MGVYYQNTCKQRLHAEEYFQCSISPRSTSLTPLSFAHPGLHCLLPLSPDPQQTTRHTREPNNAIIQLDPPQRRARDRNITHIANELHKHRVKLLGHLLRFHNLLGVGRRGKRFGAEGKVVVGVDARGEGEGEACGPCAVGFAEEAGGEGGFVD